MKLNLKNTLVRLLVLCFFFSLWGGGLYAQTTNDIRTATVTIGFTNESLKEALFALGRASGFQLILPSDVDATRRVDLPTAERTVEATLTSLLQGSNLEFRVQGNTIVLSERVATALPAGNPTQLQVTGRVTCATTGETLPFVTVVIRGTTTGTITSIDGTFALAVPSAESVLQFSLLGYETLELPVDATRPMTVRMQDDAITLEGVIVTGYQTISRERATGAFNIISGDEIERARSSDLSTALLGSVAGMQGRENPDGSIDFTIRGIGTLHADRQPLVVVDGFPVIGGFADINPNDVASVTVLRDAAAASIWGARAANGVIVVVTRSGRATTDQRLDISFNAMTRIGHKIDLSTALLTASAADQVAWERMAFENRWFTHTYSDAFGNLHAPFSLAKEYLFAHHARGVISLEEMNAGLQRLSESDNRQQIRDHLLLNPILQQYNFTLSSSGPRIQNYVSLMYEHGIGNMVGNGLDRFRLNFNTRASVFNWLDFTFSTNLHYVHNRNSGATMAELRLLSPYELILNEDGSYGTQLMGVNREQWERIRGTLPFDDWDYNILREVRARDLTTTGINSRFQAGLTFRIIPGLTFDTRFQYEYNIHRARNLYREDSYFVRDLVNFVVDYDPVNRVVNRQFIPKGGILQTGQRLHNNYTWRNQLNFDREFNRRHSVVAIVGTEVTELRMERTNNPWAFGFDEATNRVTPLPFGARTIPGVMQIRNVMGANLARIQDALWTIDARTTPAPRNRQVDGADGMLIGDMDAPTFDFRNDRYLSFYGNVSYSFDDRYTLTLSARSDATNFITNDPRHRWSPFWSIGGLWHLHREDFMSETSDWLNRLSLRLTYGYNGNMDRSTSPLTLIRMGGTPSPNTGTFTGSIPPGGFGNPLLRWERTGTTNVGVDFVMFRNFLFGSIDFYNKKGRDILGQVALPAVTGAATQMINQASILNRGIEVELGIRTRLGASGISMTTNVVYAYNHNRVLDLHRPNLQANAVVSAQTGIFVEGHPVGSLWSYVFAGMIDGVPHLSRTVDGVTTYYAMNSTAMAISNIGDGFIINSGSSISPHTAGWRGVLSGHGFTFSFLVTGNFGGHFRNQAFNFPQLTLGKDIITRYVNDVINGSPNVPSWPASTATPADFSMWGLYTGFLNTLVESSSFIKLRELNLEYELPRRWLDRTAIRRASLFAQARNLGNLWVANSRGYDPEWLPGTLPPTTSYVFGLSINF